ncbi:MAG: Ig-like domain-containing protein, partial [Elusimicrobiota bacterium]|nr:Ig-like domain-containing protein [Elusimicrobiota bacterium]
SVSTWAVSDLSGNPVAETVIQVETDISTETPKVVFTEPASGETSVGRREKIAVYFDQYLNLDGALLSIRAVQLSDSTGEEVYNIIEGTLSAVNYSAVQNTPYGEVVSSITFIPDEKLPGNSDIQITVLAKEIKTFADVALGDDYKFKFTTTLVKNDSNLVVSPSGRMSVFIPSGEFPSDGQVLFTEELPAQEPVLASLAALNAANRAEAAWENRYHYPFEELTFEVVFVSSSGASAEMIFDSNAEIIVNYSDFIIEEKFARKNKKTGEVEFYNKDINYIKEESKSPVSEETLRIYYLAESADPNHSRWIPLSTVRNTEEKTLRAPLKHFSVYTVMGGPVFDLSEAHPYPVPYKPNSPVERGGRPPQFENTLRAGITFTNLPAECDIQIYTITGRQVNSFHHSDADLPSEGQVGNYYWYPVVNSSGQPVASGTYIYYLTSEGNEKTGKLMVIR